MKRAYVWLMSMAMMAVTAVGAFAQDYTNVTTVDGLAAAAKGDAMANIYKVAPSAFAVMVGLLAVAMLWKWLKKGAKSS